MFEEEKAPSRYKQKKVRSILSRIARGRTIEDLVLEERREGFKREVLTKQAQNRKESIELERKLSGVSSCFNSEWEQIVFQIVAYSRKPIRKREIKDEFRKVSGRGGYSPQVLNYLKKFVKYGFLKQGKAGSENTYQLTEKGKEQALPAVSLLSEWSLRNNKSSHLIFGSVKMYGRRWPYSNRLNIIRLLGQNPNKKLSRSELRRAAKMSLVGLINHMTELNEEGFIYYDYQKKGEKYLKHWKEGKTANEAVRDKRVKFSPTKYRNKLIRACERAEDGIDYKGVLEALRDLGVHSNTTRTKRYAARACTLLSTLCTYGYMNSKWIGFKRRSEAQITDLGYDAFVTMSKVKIIPSYGSNVRIPKKREFERDAKKRAALYFPHSKAYKMWQHKKNSLVEYLVEVGKSTTEKIYANTAIKNPDVLRQAVVGGIVVRFNAWKRPAKKKRRRKFRAPFREVGYKLAPAYAKRYLIS